MTWAEQALAFPCEQDTLVGVAALPQQAQDTGLLIVVGGPQYRAGSHRMFVDLARAAAAEGFASLRFDVRGMGDSSGSLRSFEHISPDIAAALDALQAQAPQVKHVVLWGLCDGASASLLYLHDHPQDTRIAGLCLLNPWVRSEASLAKARVKHYYLDRLRQRDFWLKLASGGVAWGALSGLFCNTQKAFQRGPVDVEGPHAAGFVGRMSRAWAAFQGPVTLILSGQDITAREFSEVLASDPGWTLAYARKPAEQVRFETADHTFSQLAECRDMVQRSLDVLRKCSSTTLARLPREPLQPQKDPYAC